MPIKVKLYITLVVAAGAAVLGAAFWHGNWPDPTRYLIYLALALLASTIKLKLPGITGCYSLNFLFLLAGIQYFSLSETLLAGCAAALVQSLFHARMRPTAVQILFNMANLAVSIAAAFWLARQVFAGHGIPVAASMALVGFVYFVVNTGLVSGVLSMLEDHSLRATWEQWYEWSLPYYLLGAVWVGLLPRAGHIAEPESLLLLLPLLYLLVFFYRLSTSKRARVNGTGGEGSSDGWPLAARVWIVAVVGAGAGILALAALQFTAPEPGRFAVYLLAAALASTLKIRLPGMTGTMSLGFVLTLAAIADLSFSEAVLVGGLTALVQCLWKPKQRPTAVQVCYSVAALVLSSALAFAVCRIGAPQMGQSVLGMTLVGTVLLYGSNTALISLVLGLIDRQPLHQMFRSCYFWSFPYYLVGASAVALMLSSCQAAGWQPALLVLPSTVLVYLSYRMHVERAVRAVALA